MIKKALLAAMMIMLVGVPATAQVQVDLIPYVGVYVPVADLAQLSITSGNQTISVRAEQQWAFLFGGRADVWLNPKWGLEANVGYAFSDIRLAGESSNDDICAQDASVDCSAYVWLASAKALYRIVPKPDSWYSIHLGAGLAIIGRGGKFYDADNSLSTTNVGGVLGAGVDIAVSRMMGIAIDLEDYIYKYKYEVEIEGSTQTSSSFWQNDLALTVGLVIHLGK